MNIRNLSNLLILSVISALPHLAQAENIVGTLPGDVSVDLMGRSNYSIELKLPPGTGGMLPTLSLNYNSGGPNGPLGIGWGIGGLSAIGREGSNVFYDGTPSGVEFDLSKDRFSLDGHRLIPVSGTHGEVNTIYHTAVETFNRIKILDKISGSTSPQSFELKAKSGLISYFGQTADSRVTFTKNNTEHALSWLINKIEDTTGNYMTFSYVKHNNVAYIEKIDYTGNASANLEPYIRVKFTYETRNDAYDRYFMGNVLKMDRRLTKIEILHLGAGGSEGSLISSYTLNYEYNTDTKRSRVTSIQYKVMKGATEYAVNATTFAYSNKMDGVSGNNLSVLDLSGGVSEDGVAVDLDPGTGGFDDATGNGRQVIGDFNGDGRLELVQFYRTTAPRKFFSRVYQIQENGNVVLVSQNDSELLHLDEGGCPISTYNGNTQGRPADLDGDGVQELVFWTIADHDCNDLKKVHRAVYSMNSNYEFSIVPNTYKNYHWNKNYGGEYSLDIFDVNLDGIEDIVETTYNMISYFRYISSYATIFPTSQNQQNHILMENFTPGQIWDEPYDGLEGIEIIDIDLDGAMDMILYPLGRRIYYLKGFFNSQGILEFSNNALEFKTDYNNDGNYTNNFEGRGWKIQTQLGDVNGDGLPDIIRTYQIYGHYNGNGNYFYSYGGGQLAMDTHWVNVCLNRGQKDWNGTVLFNSVCHLQIATGYAKENRFSLADFNGDSFPEFIHQTGGNGVIVIRIFRGTGSGFDFSNSWQEFSTVANWDRRYHHVGVIDYNGDNLSDIILGFTRNQSAHISIWKNNGTIPDLMTSVTNGIGKETKINYTTITKLGETVYSQANPEDIDYTTVAPAPMIVAKSVHEDTGLKRVNGGTLETIYKRSDYYYAAARFHQLGLGFLGFEQFSSVDHRNHIYQMQKVDQRAPMNGMVKETLTYHVQDPFDPENESMRVLLAKTVNDNSWEAVVGGTRFPYVAKSVEERFEWYDITQLKPTGYDDVNPYNRITTLNWFDNQNTSNPPQIHYDVYTDYTGPGGLPNNITYGNLVKSEVRYGAADYAQTQESTHVTINEYAYDDPSNWLLGRLSKSTVTSHVPGETSITKSAGFEYYSGTGLLAAEIENPFTGSGTPSDREKYKRTAYLRDSYGNITYTEVQFYDWILTTPASPVISSSLTTLPVSSVFFDTADKGRMPRWKLNALGHAETTYYDYTLGVPTEVTGPNGQTTWYDYDALGRLTKQINPDGTTLTTQYLGVPSGNDSAFAGHDTQNPQATNIITPIRYHTVTTATQAPTVSVFYDAHSREIATKSQKADGTNVYKHNIFTDQGQIYWASEKFVAGTATNEIPWTTTAYDEIGRLQWVVAPDSTITYFHYNGRTKWTINNYQDGVYDPQNPSQDQSSFVFTNPKGEVAFTTDNAGETLAKTYYSDGSLKSVTIPGNIVTTTEFDSRGNKRKLIDPTMGTWEYHYNALGQLRWQKDAKGQITTMKYDDLGRMIEKLDADGRISKWSYYNTVTPHGWINALKQETTQLSGAPAGVYETEKLFYYDKLGRSILNLSYVSGLWYYTYTRYDRYSRVKRVDYFWRPETITDHTSPIWHSFGTEYSYNSRSFMTKVVDSTGFTWWSASESDYDHEGRIKSSLLGNGLRIDNKYNKIHQLEEIVTKLGSVEKMKVVASYDRIGNLQSRTVSRYNAAQYQTNSETFAYDALNRLKASVVTVAGQVQSNLAQDLSYHLDGRIQTKRLWYTGLQNPVTLNYTYHATKKFQVTGVSGGGLSYNYEYDANGAVIKRNSPTTPNITWAAINKPLRIETGNSLSQFVYDGGNSEVLQISFEGGTPYPRKKVYFGGFEQVYEALGVTNPKDQLTSNSSAWKSWNWKLRTSRVHIGTPAGTIGAMTHKPDESLSINAIKREFFQSDMLGSLLAVTDEGGTFTQHFSYDPWGMRRDAWTYIPIAGASMQPIGGHDTGFTGHEQLDHLGLIHMNGRIYDPIISRFISADPFVQFPDNIQSYNRYAYVLNNPLTFTDPSGYIIPIIVGIMLVGLKVKCLVTIAVAMFIAGAAQAAIMGARGADILKAGLITAATAVVAAQVGSFFDIMGTEAANAGLSQGFMNGIEVCRAAAHGISGGVFSELGGGDFASGFLAGFTGSIAGSAMNSSQFSNIFGKPGQDMGIGQLTMRTVIAGIVGGTAAELGGGKFMNGAITAAIQHLFNAEGKNEKISSNEDESEWVMGIHSNVDKDAELTDGHAWISVTNEKTGKTYTYGLWPDKHPSAQNNFAQEQAGLQDSDVRFGLEDGIRPVSSKYFRLNNSQMDKLRIFVNTNAQWKYTYTCANWASDCVKFVTGQTVSSRDYLILGTPRAISKNINNNEQKTTGAKQEQKSKIN